MRRVSACALLLLATCGPPASVRPPDDPPPPPPPPPVDPVEPTDPTDRAEPGWEAKQWPPPNDSTTRRDAGGPIRGHTVEQEPPPPDDPPPEDPPPKPTCPGKSAAGKACSVYGQTCTYGDTICSCQPICSGVDMGYEAYSWTCITRPRACPDRVPTDGERCRKRGLSCAYGYCGGASARCEKGKWKVIHYGPPP